MEQQHRSTTAQPQADGDSRPFDADAHHGSRLLHWEKSGPAFAPSPDPVDPVADMLAASLVAQTLRTTGDVLSAIHRRCFLDLMPAWTRLLRVAQVTVPVGYRQYRERWQWDDMRDSVILALCYADLSPARWMSADMLLRSVARDAAVEAEGNIGTYQSSAETVAMLAENAAAYRSFSEGRSVTQEDIAAIERMEAIYEQDHLNTQPKDTD